MMYTKKQVITPQMTVRRKYIKMQFDDNISFFCVAKVDMKPKQRVTLTNATRNQTSLPVEYILRYKTPNENRNKTDLEQWLET